MKTKQSLVESTEVAEDVPCISLLIPFNAKVNRKATFSHFLNAIANREIERVAAIYPREKALPVITKFRKVVDQIDYLKHHNKSLAIIVSPLVEKVYFFNYTDADSVIYKKVI